MNIKKEYVNKNCQKWRLISFPRENFTFWGCREEGQFSNRVEQLREDSIVKLDIPSEQRLKKGNFHKKENTVWSYNFPQGIHFLSRGYIFLFERSFLQLSYVKISKYIVWYLNKLAKLGPLGPFCSPFGYEEVLKSVFGYQEFWVQNL